MWYTIEPRTQASPNHEGRTWKSRSSLCNTVTSSHMCWSRLELNIFVQFCSQPATFQIVTWHMQLVATILDNLKENFHCNRKFYWIGLIYEKVFTLSLLRIRQFGSRRVTWWKRNLRKWFKDRGDTFPRSSLKEYALTLKNTWWNNIHKHGLEWIWHRMSMT